MVKLSMFTALGFNSLPKLQSDTLSVLVHKHLKAHLADEFENVQDFSKTGTERGFARYDHVHLATAMDVLNTYQRERRARSTPRIPMLNLRAQFDRSYKDDPRTRLIELIKRWVRGNVANASIEEDEIRGMCSLCRDILNNAALFPARNKRSFIQTIAEVYEHFRHQLNEALERDRSCAELISAVLRLSRNLLSDAICYLLLAATDLKQTDTLPSVEAVALWSSLPPGPSHPLPSRADTAHQTAMAKAWKTTVGTLVAAVLSTPYAVRLFDGRGAEEEARRISQVAAVLDERAEAPQPLAVLLLNAEAEMKAGSFGNSGLCGAFRKPERGDARKRYLLAVEAISDLTLFIGEALVQFQRISDGMGDFGMIRVSQWLHPFIEELTDKVTKLKGHLEWLHQFVDQVLVIAKAKGMRVDTPFPTDKMSHRAHDAYMRAVDGRDSHAQALLTSFEQLRQRSHPDRLPYVVESLGDACSNLQALLTSPDFQNRISNRDAFPQLVSGVTGRGSRPALAISDGDPESPAHGFDPGPRQRLDSDASSRSPSPEPRRGGHGEPAGRDVSPTRRVSRGEPVGEVTPAMGARLALPPAARQGGTSPGASPRTGPQRSPALEVEELDLFVGSGPGEAPHASAPPVALTAEVYRLTEAYARHDKRLLSLSGTEGMLYIFDKGSTTSVKTEVNVRMDIVDHTLSSGLVLMVFLRRRDKPSWRSSFTPRGRPETKVYHFEFLSTEQAQAFQSALQRLRSSLE